MSKAYKKTSSRKSSSISDLVKQKISKMPEGTIFTAKELGIKNGSIPAIEMALSRLVKNATIIKISKGLFSKPKMTRFGRVDFTQDKLIDLAGKKTKLLTTSHTLFNNLGISTQVPGKQTVKAKKAVSPLTAKNNKFFKIVIDKNIVSHHKKDKHLVEILEAILDMRKVFDATADDVIRKLSVLIHNQDKKDLLKLCDLSLNYRPFVRAILGAIIENSVKAEIQPLATFLRNSLNPTTKYKLGITNKVLPNRDEWNIQ